MQLTERDLALLLDAYTKLENPSLAIRLSSAAGMPVEAVTPELGKRAPEAVVDVVSQSTNKALEFVLQSSVWTMKDEAHTSASPKLHTAAAITTGAVGGGLVNTIFISHFQDMARGHFSIRGLERKYGADVVQDAYRQLKGDELPG